MYWTYPDNYYYQGYPGYEGYYDHNQWRGTAADPSDIQALKQSAAPFLPLTQEINRLLTTIAHSTGFARQLKEAAAAGQNEKVRQLIRSVGVNTPFKVR